MSFAQLIIPVVIVLTILSVAGVSFYRTRLTKVFFLMLAYKACFVIAMSLFSPELNVWLSSYFQINNLALSSQGVFFTIGLLLVWITTAYVYYGKWFVNKEVYLLAIAVVAYHIFILIPTMSMQTIHSIEDNGLYYRNNITPTISHLLLTAFSLYVYYRMFTEALFLFLNEQTYHIKARWSTVLIATLVASPFSIITSLYILIVYFSGITNVALILRTIGPLFILFPIPIWPLFYAPERIMTPLGRYLDDFVKDRFLKRLQSILNVLGKYGGSYIAPSSITNTDLRLQMMDTIISDLMIVAKNKDEQGALIYSILMPAEEIDNYLERLNFLYKVAPKISMLL